MQIENATTVHRLWGSLEDVEFIAAFQYDIDARRFCEACIATQPANTALVWVSHYSGKMSIVRQKPDTAVDCAAE